jgi:hypothetical protein
VSDADESGKRTGFFVLLMGLGILVAAAAAYYGWGPDDPIDDAVQDAAGRERFGE